MKNNISIKKKFDTLKFERITQIRQIGQGNFISETLNDYFCKSLPPTMCLDLLAMNPHVRFINVTTFYLK